MGDFMKRLSKFVQGLLDKFKKSKKQYDPLAPESNGLLTKLTKEANEWEEISESFAQQIDIIYEDIDTSGWENFFSISRTFLPKRYRVKTLILTLAANQESDYQAVDMSQYEEKGLAHYIVGSTKSPKELRQQWEQETGEHWNEEEDGAMWVDGLCSAIVGRATLLHYEELGVWDVEYDDEA